MSSFCSKYPNCGCASDTEADCQIYKSLSGDSYKEEPRTHIIWVGKVMYDEWERTWDTYMNEAGIHLVSPKAKVRHHKKPK
jgi:hypothetical protein